MSSPFPEVPLPVKTPVTSPPPPRSRRSTAHSITETSSFARHHRPHVRHQAKHREKDKHKDRDQDKGKDENSIHTSNSNIQPTISLTTVETGTSRSENVTPAHSQNASRRTSLLGLNAEQDGASLRADGKGSKEAELINEREKGFLRATFVPLRRL
jgi:hypothetical protein